MKTAHIQTKLEENYQLLQRINALVATQQSQPGGTANEEYNKLCASLQTNLTDLATLADTLNTASGQAPEQQQQAAAGAAAQNKQPKAVKLSSIDDQLERELVALGLRVKKITADGNCFFRAVSDQLEGSEHGHSDLRARVVAFMREHEEDFAPFVEDDQTFGTYINRMKKEGVWAGHMELQAASLLLEHNIFIYQAGQPRWSVMNFPSEAPCLHLSYHDGEHYNSIRLADDYGLGPPQPVVISAAGVAAAAQAEVVDHKIEQQVAANTGCENPTLIRQVLQQYRGDVDAAIEHIIEVMAAEVDPAEGAAPEGSASAAAGSQASAGSSQAGGAKVPSDAEGAQQQREAAAGQTQQHPAADAGASAGGPAGSSGVAVNGPTGSDHDRLQRGDGDMQAAAAESDGTAAPLASAAAPQPEPSDDKQGKARAKDKPSNSSSSSSSKHPSRNKKCPCGSSLKYKNCCGAAAAAAERRKAAAPGVEGAASVVVQLETLSI